MIDWLINLIRAYYAKRIKLTYNETPSAPKELEEWYQRQLEQNKRT